jgi:hypothetical protein
MPQRRNVRALRATVYLCKEDSHMACVNACLCVCVVGKVGRGHVSTRLRTNETPLSLHQERIQAPPLWPLQAQPREGHPWVLYTD